MHLNKNNVLRLHFTAVHKLQVVRPPHTNIIIILCFEFVFRLVFCFTLFDVDQMMRLDAAVHDTHHTTLFDFYFQSLHLVSLVHNGPLVDVECTHKCSPGAIS